LSLCENDYQENRKSDNNGAHYQCSTQNSRLQNFNQTGHFGPLKPEVSQQSLSCSQFISVVNSNYVSIMHRFTDTETSVVENRKFFFRTSALDHYRMQRVILYDLSIRHVRHTLVLCENG